MQHADTRTFLKHYLSRRVTVDTQAIVRGLDPQNALMRAACRMSRSIDPRRPQELTKEQSLSVDLSPCLCRLIQVRKELKCRLKGPATKNPVYKELSRQINNERQCQRHTLRKDIQDTWDKEQPVIDIERQLSGLNYNKDAKTNLESLDDKPLEQKRLIATVMTLPAATLEDEMLRRNAAINAITAYCKVEEGGCDSPSRKRGWTHATSTIVQFEENTHPLVVTKPGHQAFNAAMLSVYQEERPTICFLCLGKQNLPMSKRIQSFSTPGNLSKHFQRKHLSNLKKGEYITCNLCRISLQHKMHLQSHAIMIHGTVS
jgi:hypothetical protein